MQKVPLHPEQLHEALKAAFDIEDNTITAVIDALAMLAYKKEQANLLLLEQQDKFDLPRCNGKPSWNDNDAYAGRYLYVIHGKDVECPYHGKPKPGGRIRKGHGSDPGAYEEALEAMRNWHEWEEAQKNAQHAVSEYTNLRLKIERLLSSRGW